MRITEVNQEHTRLFLYGNGQIQTYPILAEFTWEKTGRTYLAFADTSSLADHGMWKINAAAVRFHPQSGLLESFSEVLSHEEWTYLAHEIRHLTQKNKEEYGRV